MVLVQPLEDGSFGLGVHSEADRLLHGSVDDRLCDAALLRHFFRFRFTRVSWGGRGGLTVVVPAVAIWSIAKMKTKI